MKIALKRKIIGTLAVFVASGIALTLLSTKANADTPVPPIKIVDDSAHRVFYTNPATGLFSLSFANGDFITGKEQFSQWGNHNHHYAIDASGPFELHTKTRTQEVQGRLTAQLETNKNGMSGSVIYHSNTGTIGFHTSPHQGLNDAKKFSATVIKDFLSGNENALYGLLPAKVRNSTTESAFVAQFPSDFKVKQISVTTPITYNGSTNTATEMVKVLLHANGEDKTISETWVFDNTGGTWSFDGAD